MNMCGIIFILDAQEGLLGVGMVARGSLNSFILSEKGQAFAFVHVVSFSDIFCCSCMLRNRRLVIRE